MAIDAKIAKLLTRWGYRKIKNGEYETELWALDVTKPTEDVFVIFEDSWAWFSLYPFISAEGVGDSSLVNLLMTFEAPEVTE